MQNNIINELKQLFPDYMPEYQRARVLEVATEIVASDPKVTSLPKLARAAAVAFQSYYEQEMEARNERQTHILNHTHDDALDKRVVERTHWTLAASELYVMLDFWGIKPR